MMRNSPTPRPARSGTIDTVIRLAFLFLSGMSVAWGAPAGSYTTIFTVPKAPDCIPAGKAGFKDDLCMKSEVGRVSIVEESTAEILADCEFNGHDSVTTAPKPGESYSCERKVDARSGATEIRVYSKQANLPILHVYHLIVRDGAAQGIWQDSFAKASDGVAHAPDGKAYADPYAKPELKFAGHKQFFMVAKKGGIKRVNEAVGKLTAAGYDAVMRRFANGIGEIDVYDTFDGRALIEERILKKDNWKPRKDRASTRGNKGTYDSDRYRFKGTEKVGKFDVVVEGESVGGLYGEWNVTWNAVSSSPGAKTAMSMQEKVQTSDAPGSHGDLKGQGTVVQSIKWDEFSAEHKGTMSVKGTATIGGTDDKPTITLTFTEFSIDMTGRASAGDEDFDVSAEMSGAGNRAERAATVTGTGGGAAYKSYPYFTAKPKTYEVEVIK